MSRRRPADLVAPRGGVYGPHLPYPATDAGWPVHGWPAGRAREARYLVDAVGLEVGDRAALALTAAHPAEALGVSGPARGWPNGPDLDVVLARLTRTAAASRPLDAARRVVTWAATWDHAGPGQLAGVLYAEAAPVLGQLALEVA